MRRHGTAGLLAILSGLALLAPTAGEACGCQVSKVPTSCEMFSAYSIVLVGTVKSFTRVDGRSAVVLRVDEAFKGLEQGQDEIVIEARDGRDCGGVLNVGQSYLLFPWRSDDGTLLVQACSWPQRVASGDPEVALFRQLVTGKLVNRITGRVGKSDLPPRAIRSPKTVPLPEVVVTARGGGVSADAQTDSEGRFSFNDLPAGEVPH